RVLMRTNARNGYGPSIINAGDGPQQHPTQALFDAMTIPQRLGISMSNFAPMQVKNLVDCLHTRVVRSNDDQLTKLGAHVTLVTPPTLLPFGVETWPVKTSVDFDSEIADADVVMMLRVHQERMNGGFFPSHREYATLFGLSKQRAALMKK